MKTKLLSMLSILMAVCFFFSCGDDEEEMLDQNVEKPENGKTEPDKTEPDLALIVGEAVDLGLSVKWSNTNVGAENPEDWGYRYAWGETEPKGYSEYDWNHYKWYSDNIKGASKYCVESVYGIKDGKLVLEPEDDVAHVKWGGAWRMPTVEEMKELVEKCEWKRLYSTYGDPDGFLVTGPSGNSIFFPLTRNSDGKGSNFGEYWTSSVFNDPMNQRSTAAHYLRFYDYNDYYVSSAGREVGRSVRPVCE